MISPFRCFGNVLVEPHVSVAAIENVDVVIVCDLYTPIDTPPRGRYPAEVEWLRRMHDRGAIVASVCSGSLLLAEAGLLNGLQCAGHWAYRNLFYAHYPKVQFRVEAVLSCVGDDARIITAAAVTSWQDLAIHLIKRLCGPQHAIRTAKVYLLSGHLDGQLPFAAMNRRPQKNDAMIGKCQDWIAENYGCANPVGMMAQRAGLKPRTFARRFQSATGYLPMDYVHTLRIEEAKQLIEMDGGSIDDIGVKVGYEDATFFRRLFKRKTGLTPAVYRRKFTGMLSVGR